MGFSVPQLLNYSTKFLLNSNIQSDIVRIRHYYFHSGISIKFKEIQFEPSFWIKYVENSPIYIDGVIRFVFNETMRLG
ncbi:MAG: type IX secretion system membrane protein PorP/SprF [Saprospiraceae bacterium]|nr:type IX secretion system membrane protein PorP/SprF [Saprospiraceae bacterium]